MFRFSKLTLAAAAFVALGLAAATETRAVPVVVTDSSMLGTTTNIDFQSQTPNTGYTSSLTVAPVTFAYTGPAGANNGVGVLSGNGTNGLAAGNNALFVNTDAGQIGVDTLQITFAPGSNVTAFGFDIKPSSDPTIVPGSTTPAQYRVTITDATGDHQFVVTADDYNTFSFAGFTDDSNITSIRIAMIGTLGGQPFIDNFRYTTQAPDATPEPATLLLFGSGLAGLASLARKRRGAAVYAEACE